MNDARTDEIIGSKLNSETPLISTKPIAEPKIVGMFIRNDIFRASEAENPLKTRVKIVIPEREIPGMIDRPWTNPIRNPSLSVKDLESRILFT